MILFHPRFHPIKRRRNHWDFHITCVCMPRDKKTKGSFPSFLCCFPSFESVPSFLPSEPSTFQQFRRRRRNCILSPPLHPPPPLLHRARSELKVNPAAAARATGRSFAGAPPTRPGSSVAIQCSPEKGVSELIRFPVVSESSRGFFGTLGQ